MFLQKNTCFKAVQTLSMQIFSSETVGLVGESGSGKSTLAKMLLMLEPPSEGEIF
ncbi:MAG: ATP-binding cassette domain-containing protein [Parachlamydiaceae bacterium]|nr:MAG: ATP-binding cassette domain-containing protein [Parachlamydiaceae bacterium]